MKCFDNVKNFCQFRKELISNQSILYQVYNTNDIVYRDKEENFVDISQAVKIKLEIAEGDSSYNNTHDLSFESDAIQDESDPSYNFKNESQNTEFAIYSKSTLCVFVKFI